MKSKLELITGFSALVLLQPNFAIAQAKDINIQSPLLPLYECSKIKDSAARLSCFDTNVAILEKKESENDIVAIDAPKIEEIKKEAFGFNMPTFPKLLKANSAKADKPVERQNLKVIRIGRFDGKSALFTENDQIWVNLDSDEFNAPSQMPLNITIRAASLGSFILSFEGRNKGYRVRRMK